MLTLKQLTKVCELLNQHGVRYVVIGGWAINIHGYERATRDIDLIVDVSDDNIAKIKQALASELPEACAELSLDDVTQNVVVRMVGEAIVVDLMGKVGDVDYKRAVKDVSFEDIDGVRIPVAGLETMLYLKSGIRDIDKKDYLFLCGKKEYLKKKK